MSAGAGIELSTTPTVVIEARPDTLPAVLRALWRYRVALHDAALAVLEDQAPGT